VGNTIWIGESPKEIARLVHTAYTDPKKIRLNDPGRPEADPADGHPGCVVWEYHRKFNPGEAEDIARRCRAGQLGCVADKQHLSGVLADFLAPIRERRAEIGRDPNRVWEVIADGDRRARAVAQATMREVREAMGLGRRES
jgi:tryptophanyl-tRNA synthetase